MSCLKATNVNVGAYLDASGNPILQIGWQNQGIGSLTDAKHVSYLVNGQYITVYGGNDFPTSQTGSTFAAGSVPGGIDPGDKMDVVVRIVCNDGSFQDSDTVSYTVPNTIPSMYATPISVRGKKK